MIFEWDLEEPRNIWRKSIPGRSNYKGKVSDVGVWKACCKNSKQVSWIFPSEMRADRARPGHRGFCRSILVRISFLKELGSHQKVLRKGITGSDLVFTFYKYYLASVQFRGRKQIEEAVEFFRWELDKLYTKSLRVSGL